MRLFYNKETPRSVNPNHHEFSDDLLVWQMHTLPLGNGYLGASVYGYCDTENIQITENSFANPYDRPAEVAHKRIRAGVISFANIYLHFGHKEHSDYERELSLDDAIFRVRYTSGGARYVREMFASYPDRVLCIKISREDGGRVDFDVTIDIPYIADYCQVPGDGLAREGTVSYENGEIVAESRLSFYNVIGQGRLRVLTSGGEVVTHSDRLSVTNATEAVLIFAVGTNYRMESRVFLEADPKKKLAPYPHPEQYVCSTLDSACSLGYKRLLDRHLADYRKLYERCEISFGGDASSVPTDELVRRAVKGDIDRYLEALMFAYGRYLLIASSRPGCLPANLQGVWSGFRSSPWSAGYWHNINVQMNYWPSQISNLAECFISYSDYNQAYMPLARRIADEHVAREFPENLSPAGENGWIIGTGAWPYTTGGPGGHSGPGTGAFTSLLFWDHYEYTGDREFLLRVAYPVLREMSVFFSKTLIFTEGRYLVGKSASPEQPGANGGYHKTVGCAFDQQMIYENYKRTLEAAQILSIEEPLLDTIRRQLPLLDPVLIGESGQVKEFREERFYGDIGEWEHRHVSHLVALYPGTLINETTPEFLEAAKVTLKNRGNGTSGWSRSHRLALYARAKDGAYCYDIIRGFFRENVPANLWDQHPPFQIDGNFGYVAGVAEMLLQSQAGYIELLPALPDEWSNGYFKGLVARGNFVVDCSFENKMPKRARIFSRIGSRLTLKEPALDGATVLIGGERVNVCGGVLTTETAPGDIIEISF